MARPGFAHLSGAIGRHSDKWSTGERSRLGEGDSRHVALLALEWEVLSKRMVGIAVPHENAAQVGVIRKLDAHHVINLALVPIGSWPDIRNCGDGAIVLADRDFEAEVHAILHGVKLVNDLVAGFVSEVINAR